MITKSDHRGTFFIFKTKNKTLTTMTMFKRFIVEGTKK